MTTTNFTTGTVITSEWLNDVDDATYAGSAVYTPAGTGAVATTVQAKLRESVSVEDFGTNTSPGVTDMTAAINAAIVYASSFGGGKVVTNQAQLITSPILMKSGVQLEINNTLTCSGMSAYGSSETDHSAVLFMGTSVLTSALTSSGVRSDTAVAVASGAGFATGDMVVIEDSSYFGAGTSAGVNSSLAQVINVVGDILTIDTPLPTAFPAATSLVRKVTLCENASVSVKNIAGAPYQGVTFQWARHCLAANTSVNPVGKDAIYFHSAFGNLATNIIGLNPVSTVSPFGYGCLFDFGASDNIIENSYFEGTREISVGEYGRRNIIRNNRCIYSKDTGINTHGLGAEDTLILDNIIIAPDQYGIAIGQLAPSGKAVDLRTVVRGNTVINSTSYAIREVQYSPGTSIASDTVIEGNTIRYGASTAIFISGAGVATDNTNPVISNNKIANSGARGVYLSTSSVKNVNIVGNRIDVPTTDGILMEDTGDNIFIDGNMLTSVGGYGIRQVTEGARIILGSNKVFDASAGKYLNVGTAAPTTGTGWQVGDIMPNVGNLSAGANVGWVLVSTGPNVWKSMGLVAA